MIFYASAFFCYFLLACQVDAWSSSSSSVLPRSHHRAQHYKFYCSISTNLRSRSAAAAAAHPEEDDTSNDELQSSSNNLSSNSSSSGGGSTAIILNLNARSVSGSSKELISLASSIVGEKHVYVTRTIEDALAAARMVVRKGRAQDNNNITNRHDDHSDDDNNEVLPYSLVVPVGGDGTLSGWIDGMVQQQLIYDNEINSNNHDNHDDGDNHHYQMKVHEAVGRLPTIGYLPMGTGNGLGYVIGCRMPKTSKSSQLICCAESSSDDDNDTTTTKKRKWSPDRIKSKLSIKRRKVEHAGRVMRSLKLIGDQLQQQQQQNEEEEEQQNDNEQEPQYSVIKLPVMEVTHHSSSDDDDDEQNNITTKGDLCFFAGSGFDSLMLEDFKQVKAWSKSPQRSWTPSFVKDMLSSVAGYCVALVTKTLPQALLHQTHKINVKVTTTDEGTLWIDHRRGDFSELAVAVGGSSVSSVLEGGGMDRSTGEEEVSDGNNDDEVAAVTKKKKKKQQHLIYSGVTGILAASTTPFYGGGMRLFPYARLFPNKLQLRIGRISPLTGFLRIPAIFEGSYRDKSEGDFGCLDFVGNDFEVEVSSTRYEEYLKRKKESKKNTRWWSRRRKRSSNDTSSDETKKPPTGFPFQHSGESMGIKERFRVRVVKQPVKFISFLKPRIVVDD